MQEIYISLLGSMQTRERFHVNMMKLNLPLNVLYTI